MTRLNVRHLQKAKGQDTVTQCLSVHYSQSRALGSDSIAPSQPEKENDAKCSMLSLMGIVEQNKGISEKTQWNMNTIWSLGNSNVPINVGFLVLTNAPWYIRC